MQHDMHKTAHDCLLQANTQETLSTLNMLVCHPSYTLPVGSCFKPCLLRLVSALVELHMQQPGVTAASSQPVPGGVEAFSVALITLLELAPHIDRCAQCMPGRVLHAGAWLFVCVTCMLAAGCCIFPDPHPIQTLHGAICNDGPVVHGGAELM